MKRSFIMSLPFALLILLAGSGSATVPISDDEAILEIVNRWETAWNAHDMSAMGNLIAEDADFVNVAGLHWKGKPQIVREHAERHRTNLKLSSWRTEKIGIQKLGSGFALVHIEWGMTGDTEFDGTPREPRRGIFSWLVTKTGDRWLIRAVQNTNVTPRK